MTAKKYRNTITGEWTEDRAVANKWYEEGANVEFWHYSKVFDEWVNYMDMEH